MSTYTTKSLEGKMILLATILASGMAFLDGSVVNIAIPALQEKFSASITSIQWVINGYALMLCALILISGALGDHFGRKRIFLYGMLVFIVSSFLCSISSSITMLAIFRCVQGIGGAMMVPGSLSIINSSFESSVRGKAIGIWSGFAGGVAALGPLLGGWLVQTLGWPAIFYINIPIGFIALFVAIRYIPETKNKEATKIDVVGAVLIFAALSLLTYGLITAPDVGWANWHVVASIFSGVTLSIIFVVSQLKSAHPLVPFQIFKSTLVTGANIATLFLYFALSGLLFFLVLNLQQLQHFTPILAGLALLPAILLITFLSGFGGTLADKFGPRLPMIAGPLLVSVGMFYLVFSGKNSNYFLQIFPSLVLFGLGMAITIASLTKSALAVEEKFSGVASGVNNAVSRIAGLLGVALLAAFVLSIFQTQLHAKLQASSLTIVQQQQIVAQQNKLGAIEIPNSFTQEQKIIAKTIIDDSFLYGFRFAMGVNAILALLSAIVSFFTIHNKKSRS